MTFLSIDGPLVIVGAGIDTIPKTGKETKYLMTIVSTTKSSKGSNQDKTTTETKDLGENNNVASQHPELVKSMLKKLEVWSNDVYATSKN